MRTPLEKITAFVLVSAKSYASYYSSSYGSGSAPVRICGQVYLRPSKNILFVLWNISALFALFELMACVSRSIRVIRGKRLRNRAKVVSSNLRGIPSYGRFKWKSAWLSFAFSIYLVYLIQKLTGDERTTSMLVIAPTLAILSFNILLALPIPEKIVHCLTVIFTDQEYKDAGLEHIDWGVEEIPEEECMSVPEDMRHFDGVIVQLNKRKALFVPPTGYVAFITGNSPFLSVVGLADLFHGSMVRINRQDNYFRIIRVQVPYALAWYYVHNILEQYGAYKGAEEIDKCIVWLVIVSTLAALLVSVISGICIVVRKEQTD